MTKASHGDGSGAPTPESLQAAERRLQAAQLAGDVAELDALLHDRLVFTGPDGLLYGKADDLQLHRTRAQVMTKLAEEDLLTVVDGGTGVTCFLGTLEGTFQGTAFAARMRYTRTWVHDEPHGWRIIAGHASSV